MTYNLHTLIINIGIAGFLLIGSFNLSAQPSETEWISLFDGETLNGWKAGENAESFRVENGNIIVHGPRSHLYYTGPAGNHHFKNFEFKAEVMTTKGSNSGIYIHTRYQESGWPSKGVEVQVNNSYPHDPIRTGSLYGIENIKVPPAGDNEWFTIHIKVIGKQVLVRVNGNTLVNYSEPDDQNRNGRRLSGGTIALQSHDPDSKVYYRNIRVKIL